MITVKVFEIQPIDIDVGDSPVKISVLSTAYRDSGGDPYTGVYEVTPSQEEQVLPTRNKTMLQDVVIHKIPPNYGLITYNGYEIMVS